MMIQDIGPSRFYNHYEELEPSADDLVLIFDGRSVLVSETGDAPELPTYEMVSGRWWNEWFSYVYLFRIDETRYFLPIPNDAVNSGAPQTWEGFSYRNVFEFRAAPSRETRLAVSTGLQLCNWYLNHRYCGHCGSLMERDHVERMVFCPSCGNREYPRINPAVIVAVRNGDDLLMTRYAGRQFKQRALVAGFCEIGETAEQTVEREVFEEAGIRIKNIEYVADQPWGFDDDLLLGYVCDLDGDPTIKVDENELATAEWVPRDQIFEEDDELTLTRHMIGMFRDGRL